MSRLVRWFFLAPLALLLLNGCNNSGGSGTPAPKVGRVVGTVSLADTVGGIPNVTRATGADVRVFGTNLHAATVSDGTFVLENIPIGSYTLVISLSGRQSEQVRVTVADGETTTADSVVLQPATRKWTVLVYMNGDNDLEPYTSQDMNEMEAALPATDQVAVVVQVDRSPLYAKNSTWSGCRRYEIRHDDDTTQVGVNSIIKEDMGTVDMGNPLTLRNFIQWGRNLYPAEHYLVVLWNHGSGWRSRSTGANPVRGISYDDSAQTYIKTIDLPGALSTSPPLDIISYDACLMQMAEIAYELRNNCSFVQGSEEDVPGDGYYYTAWLNPLLANPAMSPEELARTMARETIAHYGPHNANTQSVIDTSQLVGLAAALDTFAGALIDNGSNKASEIISARTKAEYYASQDYNYRDLYQYAELVKKADVGAVTSAATALQAAIDRTVIAHYEGTGHPNSRGISIYLPDPYNYGRYATSYSALALTKLYPKWASWLTKQPTAP
jgi:hypothetical protein